MFQKIARFFKEVKMELRKVSWPSRGEVTNSTTVVLITIAIIGLFLWFADLTLQGIVGRLMK